MSKFCFIIVTLLIIGAVSDSAMNASATAGNPQSGSSNRKSVDSLIELVIGTNSDKEAQCNAALALSVYQDTSHIEVLLSSPLLKDKHAFMFVLRALSNYDDDRAREAILPYLYSLDGIYAALAAKCYTRYVVPSSYLPLYQRIVSAEEHSQVSHQATIALASVNDSLSTALMIAALSTKDSQSRMTIAQALGKRDPSVALDPLAGLLNDEIYGVRMTAANSLGELGDLRATEYLEVKVLENDFGITGHAALAIAELGDNTAVETLILALSLDLTEPDPWAVCEALKELTGEDFGQDRAVWISWYESLPDSAGSVR